MGSPVLPAPGRRNALRAFGSSRETERHAGVILYKDMRRRTHSTRPGQRFREVALDLGFYLTRLFLFALSENDVVCSLIWLERLTYERFKSAHYSCIFER